MSGITLPKSWVTCDILGLTYVGYVSPDHTGRSPRQEAEREYTDVLRKGYDMALERVRRFGEDLRHGNRLSDEERYILAQCAEVLEGMPL